MSETVALTPFQSPSPAMPTAGPSMPTTGVAGAHSVPGFPGEVVALDGFPLTFTAKALEMIKSALDETNGEDGEYLRVGVKGGGCSGFQYSLNFTEEVDDEDQLVLVGVKAADGGEGNVKIVTDAFSASYLKGTELDYVESLQGAGFKFVNPNAKRTCGCGSSFSA